METNVNRSRPSASNLDLPLRRQLPRQSAKTAADAYWPVRARRSLPTTALRNAQRPVAQDAITQILIDDLTKVTDAWQAFQTTRARDGVYEFLQVIYDIGRRWKLENRVLEFSRLLLVSHPHFITMQAEAYAVLLFCAGQFDAKARSSWSRVLRVAEAHGATTIQAFAKEHGGINKIAALFWEIGK